MSLPFRQYWRAMQTEDFAKSRKLTYSELVEVQATIAQLQKKGLPSSKIISALQKRQPKLSERYKAERAYWTEVKRGDTNLVAEAGEELEVKNYRVILSPNACKTCREKTDNGDRVFKSSDLEKAGFGHVPPFHPNCFCILIPTV